MIAKFARRGAAVLGMIVGVAGTASAQTATQTVTFQVDAISRLAFTGSPSLIVNTAVAGQNPTQATASATYAVTTNQSAQKITAQLNSAMPTGLTLGVTLQTPGGSATSVAGVQLDATAKDVINNLGQIAASALTVSYTLDATPAAGVVASSSRVVTYTITTGP